MTKEKMNKILIKHYTKKMCTHDRELLIRLNKIFIENYETTNYIIDKNESVYLTGKYSKVNNYSKLPKNVSDACYYLDHTMGIIYIFTKVLQYNCKFFEIDLDYNMYSNLDPSIEQDSIRDIGVLTCTTMKNIYIVYRSYKNGGKKTNTNVSKLQHLIFDAIENHLNMYQESQNMYNLTCKLVNKQGNFFNDFKRAFTFKIDIFKDFFKWLKSLFEINNPVIVTENGVTTTNDILSDSGELYEKLVEVLIYAIDKLNAETIVKLMYRYDYKVITEYLSKEMQDIFSKNKDGELTNQKEIKKYNDELIALEKIKDYDKSKIENVMNPSVLELNKYMNDGILLLLRGLIFFT